MSTAVTPSSGADTNAGSGTSKGAPKSAIIFTSLALFSMFFGAGNLIFPPMLAVQSGENFWPAILGFLTTGALLPVLAVVAIALSGANVRDLAQRAGTFFGIIFPILAYLSIGAFYALPRTSAVSFDVAMTPVFGWDGTMERALFNLVFFGIALALSWNPTTITDTLGKFLTPALVLLLIIMIGTALFTMTNQGYTANETYATNAYAAGVLEGYLTMDSIAALAFSIVVISSLRHKGVGEGKPIVRGTMIAGLGAGIMLALMYIGLGIIGRSMPDATTYDSGAPLLADAALTMMNKPGQIIFALVVLLACMTTAVGLITATAEYFSEQFFGSYRVWAIIFAVASAVMATQGLEFVMMVAAPVIVFIYPPAIALVALTLIEPLFRSRTRLRWGFFVPIWVAVIWSAIATPISLAGDYKIFEWSTALAPIVDWAPLHEQSLGWILPTFIAFLVGLVIDLLNPTTTAELEDKGLQSNHADDAVAPAEAKATI
ncbi:branched-chain amino acid transport system II carrier protein [Corynebacterium aquatimens]|uniref:LIVCS family branched-chain amino acid:cation transporter n=1 Tax=Corynebacterium aquatimens TaxID=1190508 RepID=A0A931GW46_9CORY|nr:branched-chain amino acid transport system II carrier protein [Corynebacterium aquatimens]MBG6122101.1 LIVCS family branched-chain amino acid:cation transporter [Corynebacterium aquatimens]WJY65358.1 Branched-chain amino acid transport system 2 carrier protein [Corynebacterium aquatimens]